MSQPQYVEPSIQVPIHRPPMSDGMIRGVNEALHMLNISETLGTQQRGLPFLVNLRVTTNLRGQL